MNPVPIRLKGSEFECLLMEAAAREEDAGLLTMGRYGVDGVIVQGKTLLVPSKPDFDGVLATGRQFVIEAKCCDGPSFELRKDKIKPKQVAHMLTRSRFNVPCFLVIHFAERILKNSTSPAITVAIPITAENPIWQKFVDAHVKARREKTAVESQGSIGRDAAQDLGQLVPWRVSKGCRKALPDLLSFLWPEMRTPIHCAAPEPTLFG